MTQTPEQIAAGLNDLQKRACLAGEGWYPRCRECGDENGYCPHFHNWPCDWNERQPLEAAVRAVSERGDG